MGNSSSITSASAVFPLPAELSSSLPPNWVYAIVAAALGVTLLWIIAITVLILFEVCVKGQCKGVRTRQKQSTPAPASPPSRDSSGASLGTPPPPILAPAIYSSPPAPTKPIVAMDSTDGQPDGNEFRVKLEEDDGISISSRDSSIISAPDEDKSKPVVSESVRTSDSFGASVAGATDVTSLNGSVNEDPLVGMILSRPITVRQLGATIREPGYIETEFRKLPVVIVKSVNLPAGTERKNRYTNVLPTPRTRVELPLIFGHSNSDYINGNYIRGHMGSNAQYIATQGPLESTIEDFWRMVIDNNCSIIVMVTNFQERGIEKCTRYWPAQGSEGYGSVQVTLVQQAAHGVYNTSTLQVQANGGEVKTVTHYRLTFWPHQGVPKDTKTLTDFLRSIKMADGTGPAVVHCSSGIGRTGVVLACDIGTQALLQGDPKVDVLRIVSTLRQDRAGTVQTREQYRFIHEALYNVAKEIRE